MVKHLFNGLGNTVIKVWDWQSRREISTLGEPRISAMGVHGLAVSRDGQILFSGNWGLLKAWDWQMGKELYNLRAHSIQIYCLAISLNRLWLVAAGTKLLKSEDWLKDNITS